jgi:flagellar M-ring protein FliF
VPGTASNIPGAAGASASASGQSESQSTLTNFELNRTTATIAEPVGTLARQSVAVVVDHAMVAPVDDPAGARVPVARTPQEMTKITDIVRAAIGIDQDRGDVLIVENVPFDDAALPAEDETGGGLGLDFWLRALRYASLPLAVLLLALLVIRPAISALRGLRATESADGGPQTVAQLQARLQFDLARGAVPALADSVSPLRRKLIEAAREDPRAAALVIKSWLETSRDRG